MIIKINKHGSALPKAYGDFIDLTATEDVRLTAGEYKLISLGVAMKLPEGYYAEVVPRSSTFKRWGIIMANSIGIIDNDYCGANDIWGFPALAMRDTFIPKGTRICQFRLVKKQENVCFVEDSLENNSDRGGWGSTGER